MPCTSISDREITASSNISRADVSAQFIWYLLVGGLSFLTDLSILVILLWFSTPVPGALVIGFFVGTLANYRLSRMLAFAGGRYRPAGEVCRLFAVALVGLFLTMALIALLMSAGMSAVAAKIVATPIAFIWNYAGRRLFVFFPEMPRDIWMLSDRALDRVKRFDGKSR